MTTLISAKQLSKKYGARTVVNKMELEICKGDILALIGPNGAGKSTLVEILVGIRQQDSGDIHYWSQDYKQHLGVQLQMPPFFPGLSSLENLRLFAALYKKKLSLKEGQQTLELCGLFDVINTEASQLSGGQKKRLAIAIAITHQPELLFLDEPTAALDPRSRIEVHHLIQTLAEQGVSIVLTSHDMDEVSKLCSRVAMINRGQIMVEGKPREICHLYATESLEEVYLKLTQKEEVSC